MEKKRVTIKDLAKHLNLSASTISRALSDHPDISTSTKRLVKEAAKKFDYHQDIIAWSLKKRRTKTIGVIVPEIRHFFFSAALNGIEDVTYNAGYTIIICKSNEDYHREVTNTNALLVNKVAGMIVSISQSTTNCDHFKNVIDSGTPLVFFDRACENFPAHKVVVDDFDGAFSAVTHLLSSGYKHIAHIAGPQHIQITKQRFEGYKSALKKYGIPFDKKLVTIGGMVEEDGAVGIQTLLKSNNNIDAIFAANDPIAIGAILELKKEGYKIPDDLAIVGFSDNPIASLLEPPLTTVAQPAYEMGATAATILLEDIESGDISPPKIKEIKTKLIIRQST